MTYQQKKRKKEKRIIRFPTSFYFVIVHIKSNSVKIFHLKRCSSYLYRRKELLELSLSRISNIEQF